MTPTQEDTLGRWHWILLAAVLILATVLRIVGLRWGLPNELHAYSYHPDEFLTIGSSGKMAGLFDGHRSINPGLYNYPSLYLYISSLAMMVANGYGWLSGPQGIYLAARSITVLMGVGSVAATYWAGRVMFGTTAGLLAALVLAIAPLHVQHSHFATVDVPSTLLVALCLGYSALILKRGSWRDYILAGTMAGLAAGTKYNAALVVFAPIAAHFLNTLSTRDVPTSPTESAQPTPSPLRERAGVRVKRCNPALRSVVSIKLWLIAACAIAAFIISTPGSVLYTQQFLHGLTSEMHHAATGHGLVFAGTGNGFYYTFRSSLWYGFGFGFAVMFLVAAAWGLWKRDKRVLLLLAFAVSYYVLISVSQVRFARYIMPLLPAASLLIGWLIVDWFTALTRFHADSRLVWLAVLIFTFTVSLAYTLMIDEMFVGPDSRDEAARWIHEWIPKGSSIGMLDYPWYYSPPLTKSIGMGTLDFRKDATRNAPYRIVVFSDYAKPSEWWVQNIRPEWVISTFEDDWDAQRLRNRKDISANDMQTVARVLGHVDYVRSHYEVPRQWGYMREPRFIRLLGDCDNGPYCDLPHDMRYPLSKIYILRLKR